MTEEEKKPEKPPGPWTPEMVQAIITGLTPIANRFIDHLERQSKHQLEMEKAYSKASGRVLLILMGFLSVVILLMVVLAFYDKVSGDAILFLVGTVVGLFVAMVQRHLFPEAIEVSE